jgi:hypothetical protein
MLRLGNVEWNRILVGHFSGQEVARLLVLCKSIRLLLQKDHSLVLLMRSRHKSLTHAEDLIGFVGKERWNLGDNFFKSITQQLTSWVLPEPRASQPLSDGLRLFQSRTHVIVCLDSYVFEAEFFNRGLYLAHIVGSDVCTVHHYQFGKNDKMCLNSSNGSECWGSGCLFDRHRGHIMFVKIDKICCQANLICALPRMELGRYQSFIQTNGITCTCGGTLKHSPECKLTKLQIMMKPFESPRILEVSTSAGRTLLPLNANIGYLLTNLELTDRECAALLRHPIESLARVRFTSKKIDLTQYNINPKRKL